MFDKELIEKRKEITKNKEMSNLEITLDENNYLYLEKISNDIGVSIEDLIVDCIYRMVLQETHKPEEIDETIDTAILELKFEDILTSDKDYLVLDTFDLNTKSILLTNSNSLKKFEIFNNKENKLITK